MVDLEQSKRFLLAHGGTLVNYQKTHKQIADDEKSESKKAKKYSAGDFTLTILGVSVVPNEDSSYV